MRCVVIAPRKQCRSRRTMSRTMSSREQPMTKGIGVRMLEDGTEKLARRTAICTRWLVVLDLKKLEGSRHLGGVVVVHSRSPRLQSSPSVLLFARATGWCMCVRADVRSTSCRRTNPPSGHPQDTILFLHNVKIIIFYVFSCANKKVLK